MDVNQILKRGVVWNVCSVMSNSLDPRGPASSVHGVFQARIMAWLSFPSPGDLPYPVMEPTSLASPALTGGFFTTEPPRKPTNYHTKNVKLKIFCIAPQPTHLSKLPFPNIITCGIRASRYKRTQTFNVYCIFNPVVLVCVQIKKFILCCKSHCFLLWFHPGLFSVISRLSYVYLDHCFLLVHGVP